MAFNANGARLMKARPVNERLQSMCEHATDHGTMCTALMLAEVGMPRDAATKYELNVPAVVAPVVVGVNWKQSSSTPVTPVTLNAPMVESDITPVAATSTASRSSLLLVESISYTIMGNII